MKIHAFYFVVLLIVNLGSIAVVILNFKELPNIPSRNYTSSFDPFAVVNLVV